MDPQIKVFGSATAPNGHLHVCSERKHSGLTFLSGWVWCTSSQATGTGDKEPAEPKTKSVICTDCDGNGTVQCSQCKGIGVNPQDFFNGQFKAGDSCWLCGGRKEMLCGNCNGAGFVGGFLSGFDN
ncbi:hypothetical protein SSX86_001686 [Deinandra increscens subsp. villosa]|uniref:BSD2 cysteine rich domain-containing protein n=1 Tax=Deinandra increscens subsp. villosa TaxID=3103831 RepID=A0AAP0HCU4_9ASTR